MKFFFCFLILLCTILIILYACFTVNDVVPEVANEYIDIKTTFGDELHFDVSSFANLHHQFIKYKISLSNFAKDEHTVIDIVLRDQPETVYQDPISIFKAVSSEESISLYQLENYYIFVYDNKIQYYSKEDNLFKDCTEAEAIQQFKEIIVDCEI